MENIIKQIGCTERTITELIEKMKVNESEILIQEKHLDFLFKGLFNYTASLFKHFPYRELLTKQEGEIIILYFFIPKDDQYHLKFIRQNFKQHFIKDCNLFCYYRFISFSK